MLQPYTGIQGFLDGRRRCAALGLTSSSSQLSKIRPSDVWGRGCCPVWNFEVKIFLTEPKINSALETLKIRSSTWYLKFSWWSKKTPRNLITGILDKESICSTLCKRIGFSSFTFGELLFIKR
jgi:hypothetical protein